MRKTVTKKTSKKKNLTKLPVLPIITSSDSTRFELTDTYLRDPGRKTSWTRAVRLVDLAIALDNRRVVTDENIAIRVAGESGRSLTSFTVRHWPATQTIQVGCQFFTGTAYTKLVQKLNATGLIRL